MDVAVYTTNSCPWCKKVKQYLKDNKVQFREKNVEEDVAYAQEMVEKTGQQGVPVIDIDGEIIVGFDEEKLQELLKIE